MNKEFKEKFEQKASSIFDDIEYYTDFRESSNGEFIIYYKGLVIDVQHYEYNNSLNVSCILTAIKYGRKDLNPSPIDWEFSETSENHSIDEIVDNIITEITSCNVKQTIRNVFTTIESIKEDFTEQEFILFKTLLDIYG